MLNGGERNSLCKVTESLRYRTIQFTIVLKSNYRTIQFTIVLKSNY